MKKEFAILTALIFFILTSIRVIPAFNDIGYDIGETMIEYPNVAYSFGIWYWIAELTSFFGLGFISFWLIVSAFFSVSFYLYLVSTYNSVNKEAKNYGFFLVLLLILIAGYILPWFAYAHVRHATAVFLLLAGLEKKGFKKYILVVCAIMTHNLCFLYFMLTQISSISNKYFQLFIYFFIAILILFKNIIFQLLLELISYSNYGGDLDQYSFGEDNTLMLIRFLLFFIIILISMPSIKKGYLLRINLFYLFSILFTPFSGRILEYFYPLLISNIGKKRFIPLILLLLILFVEGYNVYSKFPI